MRWAFATFRTKSKSMYNGVTKLGREFKLRIPTQSASSQELLCIRLIIILVRSQRTRVPLLGFPATAVEYSFPSWSTTIVTVSVMNFATMIALKPTQRMKRHDDGPEYCTVNV